MTRRTLPAAGLSQVGSMAPKLIESTNATSACRNAASRREFLLALAGLTAASISGCRRSEEAIASPVLPLVGSAPGAPLHYATAIGQFDSAVGVIAECYDGYPTKLEGNPKHPESLGATSAQLQASVFDLYDPDRSHGPVAGGRSTTWEDAFRMLDRLRDSANVDAGASLAVLTDAHRSPSLKRQLSQLQKLLPKLRVVRHAPLDAVEARHGASMVYGRPYETLYDWTKAEIVLTLDADPFGFEGSPIRSVRGWTARPPTDREPTRQLYVIESSLSITGCVADSRWACESNEIGTLASQLALLLMQRHSLELPDNLAASLRRFPHPRGSRNWLRRLNFLADALASKPGRAFIQVGSRQPTAIHALAHWLNHALGNVNRTIQFAEPFDADSASGPMALRTLAEDLRRGTVKTLLVVGGNPAFTAPGDIDFASAIHQAELSIHLGTHIDETARVCHWHLNLAHELESFGDLAARDGTASITQPLTRSIWGGKSAIQVLGRLLGDSREPLEVVRENWRAQWGDREFELRWRTALLEGTCGLVPPPAVPAPKIEELASALASSVIDGLEVTFAPDASLYDGRFANNAWLQELPNPVTKTTWSNPAWISNDLARQHGIRHGQVLRIEVSGRAIEVPAIIAPGQANRTITLFVGQGHRAIGRHGNAVGVDVYPLRSSGQPWVLPVDKLTVTQRYVALPQTQTQFDQLSRGLAREQSAAAPSKDAPKPAQSHRPRQPQAWGMTIDLSRCTGCGTCTLACQVENNVPHVGSDGILRGRSMHWLRVDRYFVNGGESMRTLAQPVPCQHCEKAPCESVCPVGATAHSPEGLNDMVYNRCVGSRYCANNCPYEVRRFNYHEHNANWTDIEKLRMNPQVSVRSRGVMEKCTFCVQRIQGARISEKKRGALSIPDGAVVTACQQACPTQAIAFGDLADPESTVFRLSRSQRAYRLLEELNVQPRVYYLAKTLVPQFKDESP